MNVYKKIFRHLRSQNKNISNEHFNFSKFHVMSHYTDFIRLYETTDEYDISHDEVKHKYMFKDFWKRINKKETFLKQLLWHNKRRINVLIMKNVQTYRVRVAQVFAMMNISIMNTRFTRDLLELKLINENINQLMKERKKIWNSKMNSQYWCYIKKLIELLNMSEVILVLIVFIKEQCSTFDKNEINSTNRYKLERNSSWIDNFYVDVHDSITCWFLNEKNCSNLNKLVEKKIQCKSNWQNKIDCWRRDYV